MFYKNFICLLIGLIIGIRLTDFWDYGRLQQQSITSPTGPPLQEAYDISVPPSSPLSDLLFNRTRVLCWVMTAPKNHILAMHVRNTWGRRCNKLLFMSTQTDAFLETVQLPVEEGRSSLWHKTREAFKYVYEHHFDEADWFVKADDDTYFIVENLRAFLYQFSTQAPVYFGCKFRPFVRQGYMSGGAGYVLSKEALRRFALVAYPNTRLCSQNKLSEDKELGICMQNIGVVAGDSRDEHGLDRFLPLAPHHLIPFETASWFPLYSFYKRDKNKFCCSRSAISFHYIKPKDFYILDYFLYGLRPFGVHNVPDALPTLVNMTEFVNKWRNEKSDNNLEM